ncbi:hypothetical protein UT300016_09700 [Clostridium senegalense]
MKKKCCKNCRRIYFWDWYMCIHSKDKKLFIHDIENTKCKYYKKYINKYD